MSTKIYNAYRTKPGINLFSLVRDIRKQALCNCIDTIADLVNVIVVSEAKVTRDLANHPSRRSEYKNRDFVRAYLAAEHIDEEYRKQIASYERNPFNFDVSITIREFQNRYYLLGFCDWTMKDVLAFMEKHPMLEEYCYWNNTDAPDGITDEEWQERGKIWGAIDERGWKDFLALEIVNKDNWYLLSPKFNISPDGTVRKDRIKWMMGVGPKPEGEV